MSDKVLLGLYGLGMMGSSIQSVLAPFYPPIAHRKGISGKTIGTVFGIQPLVAGICAPLFGQILSKYGRKKILLSSAFLMVMSSLTFALAPMFDGTSFIIVSLLSRFFQGVGGAGIATSIVAIMSMLYREKLEEIFGIQQSLTGASMIIGPVIGMGLNLIGGFSFIFYSFSAVFFTGFLYLYFVLPPDEVTLESSNPVTWKQMLSVKTVIMDVFAICMAFGSIGALEPLLQGFMVGTFGIQEDYVPVFFIIPTLAYPVTVIVMRKCMGRFSGKARIFLGLVLISIFMQLMGPAKYTYLPNNIYMTLTSVFFLGAGTALTLIPSLTDMFDDATQQIKGVKPALISDRVSGLISLGMYFGKATSAPLAGTLIDNMDFENAISVIGFIILAYTVIYGTLGRGFAEFIGKKKVLGKSDSLLGAKEMVESSKKSFYLLEEDDV